SATVRGVGVRELREVGAGEVVHRRALDVQNRHRLVARPGQVHHGRLLRRDRDGHDRVTVADLGDGRALRLTVGVAPHDERVEVTGTAGRPGDHTDRVLGAVAVEVADPA